MEWKSDTSFCWFSCLLSRVALIEEQFTFMESSDLSRGICRAGGRALGGECEAGALHKVLRNEQKIKAVCWRFYWLAHSSPHILHNNWSASSQCSPFSQAPRRNTYFFPSDLKSMYKCFLITSENQHSPFRDGTTPVSVLLFIAAVLIRLNVRSLN